MRLHTSIRETRSDRILNGIVYVVAILLIAVTAYPLYFIIIASISDPELVAYGKVFLVPQKISLAAYQEVFKRSDIWVSYRNTIFYATAGDVYNRQYWKRMKRTQP